MTSLIVKFVANRFLKDNQFTRFAVEDPYYVSYEVESPIPGKKPIQQKVKRPVPIGISSNDESILDKVRKKAYRMDMWFTLFGLRVGYSNIFNLIPVVGSFISIYYSLVIYKVSLGVENGLPWDIQAMFIFNIAIDFLLGLIPIVGDIITIGYKANSRNFLLLEKHLERVGKDNLKME